MSPSPEQSNARAITAAFSGFGGALENVAQRALSGNPMNDRMDVHIEPFDAPYPWIGRVGKNAAEYSYSVQIGHALQGQQTFGNRPVATVGQTPYTPLLFARTETTQLLIGRTPADLATPKDTEETCVIWVANLQTEVNSLYIAGTKDVADTALEVGKTVSISFGDDGYSQRQPSAERPEPYVCCGGLATKSVVTSLHCLRLETTRWQA
jgi:hypothetical protein